MSGNYSADTEFEKLVTGTINGSGQSIELSGPNSGTEVVQLTGVWVGSLVVEGSQDGGTTYVQLPFIVQSTGNLGTTITANGAYLAVTNGYNQTRIRSTAWTSGTATVNDLGSDELSFMYSGSTEDKNYGTVGTNTLRTASQIGNATGSADFGAGATSAQSLRATVNITRNGTELDYNFGAASANTLRVAALLGNAAGVIDYNYGTVGAQTVRVASQIGNATGAAAFNAGTTNAQTLRVVLPTDQTAIPAAQSGTWTVVANEDKNYGVVGANTLRGAAQIGNSTGQADFNAGATGAQTLRTHANQGAPNTTANAWPAKITDGTDTAKVTTNSDLSVSDGLRNGGVQGALTLTTGGTTYEAKVGASRLPNRKSLVITALDDMFWGYDNTVTTSTGTPLYKNQQIVFAVDPDSTFQVWVIASANSKTARIAEST